MLKGDMQASLVQVSFCVSWAGQGHFLSSFPPECHLRRLDPHPLQVTERGKAEAADLRPGDIIVPTPVFLGFPGGSAGKESTCNARDLGWEDPLEKATAAHSSALAWRIPWTVWSVGSQSVNPSLPVHPPTSPLGVRTCVFCDCASVFANIREAALCFGNKLL